MPFSFTMTRHPNPFSNLQNTRNNSHKTESSHDLQHYPLMRNRTSYNAGSAQHRQRYQQAPPTPYGQAYQQTPPAPYSQGNQQTPPTQHRQAYQQAPPAQHGQAYQQAPPAQHGQAYQQTPPTQHGQAYQQTPPTQPQYQQASPGTNNDFLRQINKGLPDGVHYEPMDDKTMQMLREKGLLQKPTTTPQPSSQQNTLGQATQPSVGVPPSAATHNALPSPLTTVPQPEVAAPHAMASPHAVAAPPAVVAPPAVAAPPDHAFTIERLIQDERNAHIFYSRLSTMTHRADFQSALNGISEQSLFRIGVYGNLLRSLYNHTYEPSEVAVHTALNFEDGIDMAVMEENKSIRVLSELLDGLQDEAAVKAIQNIINKKMVGHNLLHFMRSNIKTILS